MPLRSWQGHALTIQHFGATPLADVGLQVRHSHARVQTATLSRRVQLSRCRMCAAMALQRNRGAIAAAPRFRAAAPRDRKHA
eukprot:352972-Chlamydomonas_euryale.AAC.5